MDKKKHGKLFIIEGLDGCGKTTQVDTTCRRLTIEDIIFKRIKLPNYGNPSADVVKQYLAGDFEGISPYASSLLYTTDRVAAYEGGWKKDYLDGKLIIADRYTQSNIIFQMTKLDKAEWDEYIEWLTNLEFTLCKLPAPDKVIFLDMPVEVSQRLMSKRYNGDEQKKDIHEANIEFLNACRETALYAAEKLGWIVISCAKDGEPLSIEEINDMVYKAVIS